LGRPAAARARGRSGGEIGHQVPVRFSQGDWPADRRRLLASSPLAAVAARKGPSVATAQTEPRSRFPFAMLSGREHFKENFHAALGVRFVEFACAARIRKYQQSLPSNRNQPYTASSRRTRNGSRADAASKE
jgi:hypothetical protein